MRKKNPKEVYTLADLEDWSQAASDLQPAIRLGVFGDPIAHSLSPQIQNAALKQSKIDLQYARFQIPDSGLKTGLRLLPSLNFIGLNLTVPHKVAAIEMVDEVDEDAQQVGAINTIAVRDGRLVGSNSDSIGFSRAIRAEFSVDLRDLRIMLLGAGGAARAIAWQCAREKCERLVLVNRTLAKAKAMAGEIEPFFVGPKVLGPVARLQAIPWDEAALSFQIANTDLIVNATPAGLNPSDPSPIPPRLLAPHLMIYDTVYARGHARTPFVTAAIEAGARATNGLSMLLHQGARSFEVWFSREAPIEAMRAALLAS